MTYILPAPKLPTRFLFHGLSLSVFSIGRLQDLASSRPILEANTKAMENERKIDVDILILRKHSTELPLFPKRIRIGRFNFVGKVRLLGAEISPSIRHKPPAEDFQQGTGSV